MDGTGHRRPRGEDAIYFDAAKNRYVGSVSLGYSADGKRIRRKVSGRTKQEVRDRLKALHQEMDAGVKSSKTCTVREAVEDWRRDDLDGTSERTRTLYEGLLGPLPARVGYQRCDGRCGSCARVEWFSIRPYRLPGFLFVGGRAGFEGRGSQAVSTAPDSDPLAGPFMYAGLVHHRKVARG